MFRTIAICCMCLALVSCGTSTTTKQQDVPTYKIGYMICNSEQETLNRFIPFTAYLSKKLGVNFEPVAIDTIKFMKEVENLDFTHSNSLLYIMMHRFHGVDILAAEKKGSLGIRSQGVIIARQDSGIKTVSDLKGKTMVFGPSLAPTGFMSQIDTMMEAGLDPEQDLAFYSIPDGSFKHEKVAYAVLYGKFDAGSLPIDDIETMTAAGRLEPGDFTIVAEGPPMPYCNFGVTQKIDEAFAAKFKEAVLAITEDDTIEINGEVVKVLDTALVQGFEDIADADFDMIREMAKRTNMPPFQKY